MADLRDHEEDESLITDTPAPVVIKTQNKYRCLTTTQAYKKGGIIGPIPTVTVHDKPSQFSIQIGRNRHVESEELASMNHSCNPNTILDTSRMLVLAAHDIAAGEELTFFYPST
ncbi:MAG: SET domain-containing protein-lysine N-methyltransferase, partial [Syntrophales bacterium]|nr:SET domain-containing protein-lysine N-methyltransferase [Syntrophales bacterium]